MQRYRLANAEHRLPMPDRVPGTLFTSDPAGEAVDPLNPFYARMIADGDLVPAASNKDISSVKAKGV